jgi:hypothetical protein
MYIENNNGGMLMETKVIGIRLPKKYYDFATKSRTFSRVGMEALFNYHYELIGVEKLDELCKGFKPYEEWRFHKTKEI